MWEDWAVVIFQGTVPSGRCRRYKLDYGLDGTTTLQLQCRLAGTADCFSEMPSGRYFNFATIVPSGRHFSHCYVSSSVAYILFKTSTWKLNNTNPGFLLLSMWSGSIMYQENTSILHNTDAKRLFYMNNYVFSFSSLKRKKTAENYSIEYITNTLA